MKFEFTAAVKAVPMADVHCTFECSTEELSIMLSDPVYQKLGEKLVSEISFKPQQNNNRNAQHQDNRKVYQEAQQRQVQEHQNAAIQKMLETISRQLDRLANHRNF